MTTTHFKTTRGHVSVVFGDLFGWRARLVYRSEQSLPVELTSDGRFATVHVQGRPKVGAVVTPQDSADPVIYLGVE